MATSDTIIYSGVEVHLGAVEAAVALDDAVEAAVAVGVNDAFLGNALYVFVAVTDRAVECYDLRRRLLDAACRTGCPRPRALRFVDAVPSIGRVPSRAAVAAVSNGQPPSEWVEQVDDPTALEALLNAR